MGVGRSVGLAGLALAAAAAYGVYAPEVAERWAPPIGGYARQLHARLWTAPAQTAAAPSGSAAPARPEWRSAPIMVSVTPVKRADFPVVLEGLGQVQAYNTVLVRARVDGQIIKIAFKEGQMVKAGRPARPDRRAAVPGRARSGEGQEGPGRSQSRQRQARPDALCDARQAEFRHPAAARHAERAGQSVDRPDRGRRGGDRRRQGAARLHDDPRADFGARRLSPHRRGQSRHRRRSRPASCRSPSLQPIAVIFTEPQEDVDRINQELARRRAGSDGDELRRRRSSPTGKLTISDNQVDVATGTIRLKAEFENKDNALWPGLAVATRTAARRRQRTLWSFRRTRFSTDRTACSSMSSTIRTARRSGR